MLKLNLQQFAEDEIEMDPADFGYEDTTPEPEQTEVETQTEVESEQSTPTEPEEPQGEPFTAQTLKLKFNHEEREVSVEEAQILAQKGLNYERAIERAKQESAQQARDAWIAEQNYTWNGKPITSEAQYKQALQEQELINRYKDRDLPEEVIQELVETRRFREDYQRQQQELQRQQSEQQQYQEFFDYFEGANGRRFDFHKDVIPNEVIQAMNNGQPLKYAYMEHHNRQLMNQIKIAKQNETNQKKAPIGSVTNHGNNKVEPEDDFLAGFNS